MTFMCTQLPFFFGKSTDWTPKIGENTDLLRVFQQKLDKAF
ncbi:hypothetical protein R77567_00085 [Ralstonia sp. LMG 32965]|uniref:Uncharacterized protein n=1 Tax=Ralstonia flatus TaxID=3058601 RepID=A0AAD2BWX7_9RALS|nr:hypothetical protein R77567_00085 [Ralstonia sp. LMG 32965]CAJ0859439.1 hypothetical protein R77564_00653 [Ralstonia sp. LMG 32965]